MTLRPTRTERTRRQYRWTLPSFRSVVWRRYITQLIGHVAPRSQRPWLALHHGCSSRRSMATTDTHGATWRSRRALAQTAEVGLASPSHHDDEGGDDLASDADGQRGGVRARPVSDHPQQARSEREGELVDRHHQAHHTAEW